MDLLCVLPRSHTDNFLELTRQMTLTAEPDLDRHLSQWFAGFNEALGMPNAHTFQVCIGGHTHFSMKNSQQIVRAEAYLLRQLLQSNSVCEIFINIIARLLDGFSLFT